MLTDLCQTIFGRRGKPEARAEQATRFLAIRIGQFDKLMFDIIAERGVCYISNGRSGDQQREGYRL